MYIENNPGCSGTHELLQVGNVIINCNFKAGFLNEGFLYTSKILVNQLNVK